MTRQDSIRPLAIMFAVGAGVFLLLSTLARCAHAAAPTDVPAPTVIPWEAWVVAGLAALAGLETALKGLGVLVRALSRLTKTTVDDHIADGIEAADAKVVEALGILRGLRGAAPVATSRTPVAPVALLAVVVLGLAGATATLPACGGTQSSRAETIGSLDSALLSGAAALRTYEHEHAMAIVNAVTSPDQVPAARAALVEFRAKVDKVWSAVDAARAAIDAANTLNDDPSLTGARAALEHAIAAIAALTGGPQ